MLCALGVRSRSPALRSLGGVGRHCPAPNACARQAERTHCSGASCILNRAHAPAAQRLPISNFRPGCQTQVTLSQRIRPFSAIAGRMCHRRENPATAAGTKDQSTNQGSDSGTSFAENDEKPKDYGTGVVGTFNRSIANYPAETLVSVIGMEMVTIYGLHAALQHSGVSVPPDLAVAFVLSRPLRRVRLPLELFVAEGLSRVFPMLTRIHVMQLFKSFPGYTEPDWMKNGGESAQGALQKGVAKLTGAIDKYGAAYTVGSRITGVGIIAVLFTGLSNGVDVSHLLLTWGFEGADQAGKMLSTWAGAILMSSVLFPWNAYCGARIAPYANRLRKAIVP